MCGITGFLVPSSQMNQDQLEGVILKMANTLHHRGPDRGGTFVDENFGISLGFRRLAILDLSSSGDQPMFSQDKRYVIVYNGEIYNFASLRDELKKSGHRFQGGSDTEVLLAGICQWGIKDTIPKLNGMFAFAIWDTKEKRLTLVRDRVGIKPLYYGWSNGVFVFGSELKSIQRHPSFNSDINRDALALFLRYNYIPTPYSIFRGISKLEPGSILELDKGTKTPRIYSYWSAIEAAKQGIQKPFKGSEGQALEQLDDLLRDAVRLRMIADVPLGAFLSGGVDSSLIVALMQSLSAMPIRTFSIGFHEESYDESCQARSVAKHLGTDHTELLVTAKDALETIPLLSTIYDEPYADSSQIPTFLLSRLTRRDVTVSLSGDGGDELFGGYNRYLWADRIWKYLGWLPVRSRQKLSSLIKGLSPQSWQDLYNTLEPIIPKSHRQRLVSNKISKLSEILAADNPHKLYNLIVSNCHDPDHIVISGGELPTLDTRKDKNLSIEDFIPWMMCMDLLTYLPDDILVKLDRASMAVSLEARVPYLDDHRIVEYALSLPLDMKIRFGETKWLLRKLLDKFVPRHLIERPKMGFSIPIDAWLRGPLRDWAETLLNQNRLKQEGFFHPEPIREKWAEHLSGRSDHQYLLWGVLSYQSWLENQSQEK